MRHWILGLSLAAAALLAVGCGPKSSEGGGFSQRGREAGESGIFRYPINTNPTTFDPHVVQDGDTIDLLQNIYEGLVSWNEQNEVAPALASEWSVSDDGLTYTFKLRDGIKFHNGREVTAEDFKWSIERASQPTFNSPTAGAYLNDIVGVEEKLAGKAQSVDGVKVIDEKTLSLTLKKKTPYFLGKLTYIVSAPLPKEAVPLDKELTQVTEMIGTGPFKVESTLRDQETTLVANADYHGGKPALDKIVRPVIKDNTTVLAKFRNGEIHLARLQRTDIDGVKKDNDLKDKIKLYDRPAIWYIGMNQKAYPPFKDRRVRRAFAMAIDRSVIINDRMGGVNQEAKGILPPGVMGHRAEAAYIPFNPAEAKKLLAEAGFPDGKGLPPLEMFFREQFPDIRLVAEASAGMLKENLGVEVKLRSLEWRNYLEKFNREELPFYHMRWAADFLDPQNFLSNMLATGAPENKLGYSNPEFDALCKQADSILEWEQRKPLYEKAEDIALQDAPWIPIYFQKDAELHAPNLHDLRGSVFGHLPHTKTRVDAK